MNRLFVACLACLSAFAAAQEKPSSKDTLIRFASFGLADSDGEYILVSGTTKTAPFVIPNNGFSTPVATPASANLVALGNAKAEPFRSLSTINLPDAGKRFLVILLPDKDQMIDR